MLFTFNPLNFKSLMVNESKMALTSHRACIDVNEVGTWEKRVCARLIGWQLSIYKSADVYLNIWAHISGLRAPTQTHGPKCLHIHPHICKCLTVNQSIWYTHFIPMFPSRWRQCLCLGAEYEPRSWEGPRLNRPAEENIVKGLQGCMHATEGTIISNIHHDSFMTWLHDCISPGLRLCPKDRSKQGLTALARLVYESINTDFLSWEKHSFLCTTWFWFRENINMRYVHDA